MFALSKKRRVKHSERGPFVPILSTVRIRDAILYSSKRSRTRLPFSPRHPVFHLFSRLEFDDLLRLDLDLLAGFRIPARPRRPAFDLEHAEAPQFDPSRLGQRFDDRVERLLNDFLHKELGCSGLVTMNAKPFWGKNHLYPRNNILFGSIDSTGASTLKL